MNATPFVVSVGPVLDGAKVSLPSRHEATNAWLLLASMRIPAAIFSGADGGWLPNTKSTAWGKQTGLDWNIPDINITEAPPGYKVKSEAMGCEFSATMRDVWKSVAALITAYLDRVETTR
jgi:hypothetical protein